MTKFLRGPLTWEEFTKSLFLRFGTSDYEDPSESVSLLKQTLTVSAYQEAFKQLLHEIGGLPESFLIVRFIVVLRDDIRLDVKIKQSKTLADAIGVARLIEEKNHLRKKQSQPICSTSISVAPKAISTPTDGILGPPPNQLMKFIPPTFR